MTKFKVGDTVKFIDGDYCKKYFTNYNGGIPRNLIIHGSPTIGEHYRKNFAKVVTIHNEYYIVNWYNDIKAIQLGFKENSLVLVKRKKLNLKEIYKKIKKNK